MGKYYITFALLFCLTLENNNIYARMHTSSPETTSLTARSHPRERQQPHHLLPRTSEQLQQHHTRQQRDHQPKQVAPDPVSEDDEIYQNQLYKERFKRHMRHQLEHMVKQKRNYNHDIQKNFDFSQEYNLIGVSLQPVPQNINDSPEMDSHENNIHPEHKDMVPQSVQEELKLIVPDPVPTETIEDSTAILNMTNASKQSKKASSGCPKCESSRQVEQITEEELRRLRIEYVKQQILEKLRLKESPNVSAVVLPKPIFEGVTLSQTDELYKNKADDDYYARTNQKFIFMKREEVECRRLGAHPSLCFSFKIDDADVDGFDVSSAVLWLYKNKKNITETSKNSYLKNSLFKQTIVVSEVEQQPNSNYLPLAKTIAIQSVDVEDNWMKINIEWPIKRWFGNHELGHLIQITCESCDVSNMEDIISIDKNYQPFIMIDTQNRPKKSRHRRNINCSNGVTECCREKLYISFADIGWDNWILQPKGYDAYFCRGSCNSVASVAQAASHHSSLLKILSSNGTRKPLDLIPCCTAKQYSSLKMVVVDSNNTATIKTLPNMVVESCGCR